jgi:hypothetical protein
MIDYHDLHQELFEIVHVFLIIGLIVVLIYYVFED